MKLNELKFWKIKPENVFIQGTGFSGVSAVRDYLREFQDVFVFMKEFDLIRASGGLSDIGQAMELNNSFVNDSVIRRAYRLIDYLYNIANWKNDLGEQFYNLSMNFLDNLLLGKCSADFRILSHNEKLKFSELFFSRCAEYVEEIRQENFDKDVFYLKYVERKEFIRLCKQYLKNVLNCLPKAQLRVLIHPFMVSSRWDNQKYMFDKYRVIFVKRDPRDVWISMLQAVRKPEGSYLKINQDVDNFISEIRRHYMFLSYNKKLLGSKMLIVNFEDMVFDYKRQTKRINSFLSIPKENHVNRKMFFDPQKSKETIGLFRNFEDQVAINKIYRNFKEMCYE